MGWREGSVAECMPLWSLRVCHCCICTQQNVTVRWEDAEDEAIRHSGCGQFHTLFIPCLNTELCAWVDLCMM